eukprot:g39111.t1
MAVPPTFACDRLFQAESRLVCFKSTLACFRSSAMDFEQPEGSQPQRFPARVRCVETGEVFSNIFEAAKRFQGPPIGVQFALNTGDMVFGHHFKYADRESPEPW